MHTWKNCVSHSLFFTDISWTIVWPFAGKSTGVGLYAVRIKDLHDPAEIDALHEIIDIRMPDVVAENEEGLFDVLGLRQRHDQMPKISEPRVHLDDYDRSVAGQRPERLLVVNFLFRIRPLDFTSNLCYLQFRKSSRACIRQVGGWITALFQESRNAEWESFEKASYIAKDETIARPIIAWIDFAYWSRSFP